MTEQPTKRITVDAPSESTILAARHLDATEGRVQIGATVDTATRSAITYVLSYIAKAHNSPAASATPLPSIHARDVHGYCPACGNPTLTLGDDSRIVCTLMDCPRPDLVNELIGDIVDARSHRAYTFCSQLVGHVTMAEFAKKITEKVTAVGQRKEAVAYANEQKQRAERAEALVEIFDALADAWSRDGMSEPTQVAGRHLRSILDSQTETTMEPS